MGDVRREPSGLQELLPLSPLQEGMLFHALLHDDGPDVYTVQWGMYLEGSLDPAAMQAAGQALLDRHANLRAGYRYVKSGTAVAVVPHRVELPWREVALSGHDRAQRDAELARCLTEERDRRFDLSKPPLIRFMLVRLGSEGSYLAITYHHILLDGWSISLLRQELFALYAREGDAGGLAPVTPYRDYLAWLATQDRSAAEAAWRRALAGLVEPTLLAGTDPHGTPLVPERVRHRLSEELSTALTQRARQLGVTLSTVIQAAWAILLSRLTGRDDVVFGFTVSGRPAELAGVESIIGLFINTVPARVRLQPGESPAQILPRLQAEQAELLAHHHVGLADIQRLAGLGPLFDTLVVYENIPLGAHQPAHSASGLHVTGEDLHTVTHYPLAVVGHPGSILGLEVFYRPDLFDRTAAEAIAGRLVRILKSMATDPEQPVGRLDILSAEERRQILVEWNDTAHDVPKATLPELFEAQAARTPEATALVFDGTELTYAELNTRANQLARVLIDRGAGPERIIALALPRSTELFVTVLAVLKTGGAYLPVDPDHPADRIAFMIDDARPVLIVTTASAGVPTGSVARHLVLDDPAVRAAWEESDGADLTAAERGGAVQLGTAAYVLYTSGSTGRPKGVVVSHDGVASLVATAVHRLRVGPDSRVLQFASISFDVAVWDLCMSLLVGGRLVIVPEERRVAGPALTDYLREHGVTHLILPPSLVAMLPEDAALPAGATLLVGTERVPTQLVTRWAATLRLFAAYGLTETTVNSTLWPADARWSGHSVPIGRPDPGTRVYLLDTALQPVPVGVTGELYIAGDGLARSYLGRPGLTAERFVACSDGAPGERMYRTGDMARYQPDGCLEFLGRDDGQVKVRGFRVELGEIESVLSEHPLVAHAAVIPDAEDGTGGGRLLGYVVPAAMDNVDRERVEQDQIHDWQQLYEAEHAKIDTTLSEVSSAGYANNSLAARQIDTLTPQLREHLRQRLPSHMIPSALVIVDRLPLTVNGKLDVKALPAPDLSPATHGRTPRLPQEQALCEVFSEVLGLDHVSVDDNFFDLGGHSLTAARVILQLRRTFDVDVPLMELFKRPTAAGLAEAVIALQRAEKLPAGDARDNTYEWHATPPSYEDLPPRPPRPAKHALLTGSTGFFGAFLLHELLTRTPLKITCLVRASNKSKGWDRVRENLKKYGLWEPSFLPRITIVLGDLSQPQLGLSSADYKSLADEADTIYHNAAQVRGLFSYEHFKGTNEGGTLELLRLATTSWLKTFHYVSTTDVAAFDQPENDGTASAYAESKWRAERSVAAAVSYGVPATIYRVPRLSGDSRTGLCNTHDIMVFLLRRIIELGSAPEIDTEEDWIPVDEAARLLVSYAGRDLEATHFVLTAQRQVRFTQLLNAARQYGYDIDVKPTEVWERDIKASFPEQHQIVSSLFRGNWADSSVDGAVEKNASAACRPTAVNFTSIVARGVDEEMLRRYVASLRPGF